MVREKTDKKKKNDLQARHIVARNLEKGVRCIETKRGTKVDYRETKPRQMPEDYVVLFFVDPEDKEFKDIMKKARRKLEIPMPAAMPCETSLCRRSRET